MLFWDGKINEGNKLWKTSTGTCYAWFIGWQFETMISFFFFFQFLVVVNFSVNLSTEGTWHCVEQILKILVVKNLQFHTRSHLTIIQHDCSLIHIFLGLKVPLSLHFNDAKVFFLPLDRAQCSRKKKREFPQSVNDTISLIIFGMAQHIDESEIHQNNYD